MSQRLPHRSNLRISFVAFFTLYVYPLGSSPLPSPREPPRPPSHVALRSVALRRISVALGFVEFRCIGLRGGRGRCIMHLPNAPNAPTSTALVVVGVVEPASTQSYN